MPDQVILTLVILALAALITLYTWLVHKCPGANQPTNHEGDHDHDQ